MQLHSVTKSLSRALVLLALVAFTASAFAQQRYVITNGEAVKRDHAYVGGKFLALDYSADAKNPTITMKESFDESCVWYCNGKPGYYYQLDAEGDRFYLMRTGQTLHVMPVLMGTQNEVFESATQWYDWTFGVATQELAGDARYYWVILNADGNSWGLSCDTYGRPGINNGDETNGHSNTATCAQYYADGTTPMVAATYTPLLAYEHEGVYEAQAGGIHSGATLNVASAIISGSSVNATVTGVTTYTSTAIPAYTEYQLREVFPAGQYSNFPEGLDAGTTADDYMYSGGSWYYRLFDVTNARQYTSKYYYEGAMHDAAPTAANSNPRTIVSTSWKLSGSGAHYLKVTPTAASTDAAPAATVTAVSPWSSTGMTATLTYSVTYSDGYTATLSQVIVLAVNPTAVAAEAVHATQGGEAPLSYTLTPAGATATVSISGVDGITYNNENNNINIASTVAPGEKNLTITATKADGTTVNGNFNVFVHPAPLEYSVADNGAVTFTNLPTDGTVYYTATASDTTTLKDRILNGTYTAATTGTQVSGTLTLTPGQTVYAVAAFGSLRSLSVTKVRNEGPATGANQNLGSGNVAVVLNDLEDHSWSYYSDPASPIRSLNPADVKITYYGNGQTDNNMTTTDVNDVPTAFGAKATGVRVGIASSETENTFVYYKTLERANGNAGTGNLAYTTIPNPFQVRPTGQDNGSQAVYSTTRTVQVSVGTTNYYDWPGNNYYVTISYGGVSEQIYGVTDYWGRWTYGTNTQAYDIPVGTEVTIRWNGGNNNRNRCRVSVGYDNSTTNILSTTTPTNNSYVMTTFTVQASPTTVTAGQYRGFYAWRIKSLSDGLTINGKSVGDIVNAEEAIEFATTNEYGNEVEFEALWAQAYVQSGTSNLSYAVSGIPSAYERNFHVLSGNANASAVQQSYPHTVTSRYPNDAATNFTKRQVSGAFTAAGDTKFEDVTLSATDNTYTANGYDLIVGRGVSGTINYVRGMGESMSSLNYRMRLENGTYNYVSFTCGYMSGSNDYVGDNGNGNGYRSVDGNVDIQAIFGSDYDRAKNASNFGATNDLIVSRNVIYGVYKDINNNNRKRETLNVNIKSGKIGSNVTVNDSYTADAYQSLYMSVAGGYTYTGRRNLVIEGGEIAGIAGGIDGYFFGTGTNNNNNDLTGVSRTGDTVSFTVRMKGGHVRGAVYGGAAKSPASGDRHMIFTGGEINGWIGNGCNGTDDAGGKTYGASKLYFGGNAICGGSGSDYSMNGSQGGIIFGAGKGYPTANGTSGEMTYGTTVVVADDANVQRNVYGGGNYGYALQNTRIDVLGGSIGGNVFGGSKLKNGPTVAVNMEGGIVTGSVYGGSDSLGTITSTVTMNISGGNVKRNVFGGGLGSGTAVTGAVSVTVNGDAHIEGCVYGGGQDGKVNNNTTVKIECGTIDENVYGGGLGTAATVSGTTTVTIGK